MQKRLVIASPHFILGVNLSAGRIRAVLGVILVSGFTYTVLAGPISLAAGTNSLDINLVDTMNLLDYAELAANWHRKGTGLKGDFDCSQTVDFSDLIILAVHWLDAQPSIYYPANDTDGRYRVSWDALEGATSYQLQRSGDGGQTWENISGPHIRDRYYDETANFGNQYRYRMRAIKFGGFGDWTEGTECGVYSATYYVNPSATDDGGDGLSASLTTDAYGHRCWQTIVRAAISAAGNSKVYLMAGTYPSRNTTLLASRTDGWVWFYPYPDSPPTLPSIHLRSLPSATLRHGYLSFNNLNIRHTQADMNETYIHAIDTRSVDYLEFKGCNITGLLVNGPNYPSVPLATISTNSGIYLETSRHAAPPAHSNILIEDCNISYTQNAISAGGRLGENIIIRGNYLHHLLAGGIFIGNVDAKPEGGYWDTDNVLIEGNHVYWQISARSAYGTDPNDWTHSSGIGLRRANVTARNNVIHAQGGTGAISFYHDVEPYHTYGGYHDMTIENNLIYDIKNATKGCLLLLSIGPRCKIRNNTVIAPRMISNTSGGTYYGTAIYADTYVGGDGNDIEFSNNVCVGQMMLGDAGFTKYTMYKNIVWSFYRGPVPAIPQMLDASNILFCYGDTELITPNPFRASGDFFLGGTKWQANLDTNYYPDPNGETVIHRQMLNGAYELPYDSVAINYGNAAFDPNDSLGTTTEHGFILNDGATRDATHHSAGAFEVNN